MPSYSLTIFDLLGKEVRTLLNEEKEPGTYTVSWNGRDKYGKEISSGIYFYQLRAGSFSQALKTVFVR
jgi:flagellar hook assembly protein FlgD